MAVNISTTWSTMVSIIARARIIEYAQRNVVIGNLFTVDDTGSTSGLVSRVDRWPDLNPLGATDSVDDHTETTDASSDLASQTITPTVVPITPAVVGMLVEVTDLLASSTPFAGLDPFLRQMGSAVAEELDDDIAALFTALNGGTAVGTTTADLQLSEFLDGLVVLQSAQAPQPYFSVLHPRQAADLGLSVGGFVGTTTNPGGAASAGTEGSRLLDSVGASTNGFIGRVAGIPVFASARCPLVTTSADRSGCIASPDAITVVRKWGMRTETDRRLPGVATQLLVNTAYGVAETADNFGVAVESDA